MSYYWWRVLQRASVDTWRMVGSGTVGQIAIRVLVFAAALFLLGLVGRWAQVIDQLTWIASFLVAAGAIAALVFLSSLFLAPYRIDKELRKENKALSDAGEVKAVSEKAAGRLEAIYDEGTKLLSPPTDVGEHSSWPGEIADWFARAEAAVAEECPPTEAWMFKTITHGSTNELFGLQDHELRQRLDARLHKLRRVISRTIP